ncbi:hypothetical protein MM239_19820 [Belliella sp. DSM 111904]|uniref:DUF4136 domain-containing protein n=1 Tax=Belliella filtrata TaxID=2923435 RepID=A0ABS9V5F0_9BACT|nr:hypothetical protein [Belliella filtrata]MCH7411644.1 hypothetical protein [Belliella filtrata]
MTKLFQKAFVMFSLLILLVIGACKSQKHQSETDLAYDFLRFLYFNPNGTLRQNTVGTEDDFYSEFINYRQINLGNRSSRMPFDSINYVDFDTLLSAEQKVELIKKLDELKSVNLDPNKIIVNILSDEEIEDNFRKLREKSGSSEPSKNFGYGIISFPIIQEGKNGEVYAIIFRTGVSFYGGGAGGNIRVFRDIGMGWEFYLNVLCFFD